MKRIAVTLIFVQEDPIPQRIIDGLTEAISEAEFHNEQASVFDIRVDSVEVIATDTSFEGNPDKWYAKAEAICDAR